MKPYLLNFTLLGQFIRLPSFGVFLATAFSFAYFWSLRNARRLKLPSKHMERLFLLILISSILGGRLFHVFFEEPSFYLRYPEKIVAVWEGGFTLYGGILCSLLVIWLYCRANRLDFANVIDIVATSTCLSIAIGRLGCFFAGCCWGKVCALPWAVALNGLKVHPTQLYEAGGAFLLFIFCQKRLFNRHFLGEVGLKAVIGYAILRFVVEGFRGDTYRGFILGGLLSYSQLISGVLIIAASSLLVVLLRKTPR